jgi:PAS domain S-box-containing protein
MKAEALDNQTVGVVVGVGIAAQLTTLLGQEFPDGISLESAPDGDRLVTMMSRGSLQADSILLGSDVPEPIRLAQRVHAFDKTIPVLILTDPTRCAELRRTIMFSPLLGCEVAPWSTREIDGLPEALRRAVERRDQRRNYLSKIAQAQPKLGRLSLFQPEVTRYLDRLLDQAPIGVLSVDSEGHILSINRQACRILGIVESEALGLPLDSFFSISERQRLATILAQSANVREPDSNLVPEVLELPRARDSVRFIEATCSPLAYRGRQRGSMLILQDVTERVLAERERQRAEHRLRTLFSALEQAAYAVMITDRNRVVEYVNHAFEQLTGYSKDEIVGKPLLSVRCGMHDAELYNELLSSVATGRVFSGVLACRRKDGSIYHEERVICPVRDQNGEITHYISTAHDVTERKNAEEVARRHQAELAHVARLSTLGEMTSGLAHELNQPLCAITTYAQTCLRHARNENCRIEDVRYGLEQVVKQAELAGAIFRRLRSFARKGDLVQRKLNLRQVVREVIALIRAELLQNQVALRIESAGEMPFVRGDAIQIEQVILNLIRNSMDAMVTTEATGRRILIRISKTGNGDVKVAISDTGAGCTQEVADRLFEPFFTTKSTGLGIGLKISQTIIEAHGGRLWMEANTGAGATFSFTLPEMGVTNESREAEATHGLYR